MRRFRSLSLWAKSSSVVLVATLLSCSSITIDAALPSDLANDRTAILSASGPGCHSAPEVGFAVCRKAAGPAVSDDYVSVFVPRTNCDREICTTVRFFSPDASLVKEVAFSAGGGRKNVTWSDLIGSGEFRFEHDAYYPVLVRTYFKNNDGAEQMTVQRGELRLFVYRTEARDSAGVRTYEPLDQASGARVWAFRASHGDYVMKWSTAGRAYVGND